MTSTTVKRTIRFPPELDAALERKALLSGLASAEFVRRVIEREISGKDTEAVLAELRAIRRELTSVVAQHGEEQKAFTLEAALALGERLTASNEALIRQLLGALPEVSGRNSHHELLPGLDFNT